MSGNAGARSNLRALPVDGRGGADACGLRLAQFSANPQTKKKRSQRGSAFLAASSLTMTYFHTGIRTIIGAESFHFPVRDGKEWDQLAMVIRLKLFPIPALKAKTGNS